jgi:hypothetical protein
MVARPIFQPLGQQVDRLFGSAADWVGDGRGGLSNRLWLARQIDRDAIDKILRHGLMVGADPLAVAKDLEDYLTPLGQRTTTRTPRGGKGNYAARRLARTEVTRAFGQATIQAAELNPFVEGVQWSLSSRHGKPDECDANASGHSRGLPAGVYRTDEVPRYPNHPHDLCVLSPFATRDTASVVSQLRRDAGLDTSNVVPFAPPQRRSSLWDKTVALFRAAKALVIGEAA